MPKKRKTKQEKIILQLKRELARLDSRQTRQALASKGTKSEPRQEAILKRPQARPKPKEPSKKTDAPIFFYDSRLVRKDLLKTLILTLVALSLEFMLYWRLR